MSDWAEKGRRCVCISDDWESSRVTVNDYSLPVRVPMLNEVLTVRHVFANRRGVWLEFEEIPTAQSDGPLRGDVSWLATCFRPLIAGRIEADIALFREIVEEARL
jgi:hypothetical protein